MDELGELYEYYGVIIPDRRFHISPQCPYLKTINKWKQGDLNGYHKEADAVMMGHLKRCPVCFNMYRFRIKVEGDVTDILLDKTDLVVLLGIAELHRAKTEITINSLSSYSGMPFTMVNDIVKRLRKLKLVAGAEWVGGVQQRGKRKFTRLGVAVVIAYENKWYGEPMDEAQGIPERANTRLI